MYNTNMISGFSYLKGVLGSRHVCVIECFLFSVFFNICLLFTFLFIFYFIFIFVLFVFVSFDCV